MFFCFSHFVVGLSRSGKSCRLRWVNYLHPDLKRGKMTPQEETLVMELHSKWGNRFETEYYADSLFSFSFPTSYFIYPNTSHVF